MCTNSLISPKWSGKESVCVAKLFVALTLAVLSVLYGHVVLLYLQLFCLCLGCMGDILMGSMMNSSLLCSMGISPLSVGVSLGCMVFMGSMVDSLCASWGSLLCPWGSPWAAGSHWGCLSAGCLALYCWGWISPVVQVLLIMSPTPCLGVISCLK